MPGYTSKMKPIPDHGEATYKGSGRLEGKKAVITGADSGIGRAVAIAYAREGADVLISYLRARGCRGNEGWSRKPAGRRWWSGDIQDAITAARSSRRRCQSWAASTSW